MTAMSLLPRSCKIKQYRNRQDNGALLTKTPLVMANINSEHTPVNRIPNSPTNAAMKDQASRVSGMDLGLARASISETDQMLSETDFIPVDAKLEYSRA